MCATIWALDVWMLKADLYRLPLGLLSINTDTAPLDRVQKEPHGNIRFARDVCTAVIVSECTHRCITHFLMRSDRPQFNFCDSISLWRAYVVYGKPRWFKILWISSFCVSSGTYDRQSRRNYDNLHGCSLVHCKCGRQYRSAAKKPPVLRGISIHVSW